MEAVLLPLVTVPSKVMVSKVETAIQQVTAVVIDQVLIISGTYIPYLHYRNKLKDMLLALPLDITCSFSYSHPHPTCTCPVFSLLSFLV